MHKNCSHLSFSNLVRTLNKAVAKPFHNVNIPIHALLLNPAVGNTQDRREPPLFKSSPHWPAPFSSFPLFFFRYVSLSPFQFWKEKGPLADSAVKVFPGLVKCTPTNSDWAVGKMPLMFLDSLVGSTTHWANCESHQHPTPPKKGDDTSHKWRYILGTWLNAISDLCAKHGQIKDYLRPKIDIVKFKTFEHPLETLWKNWLDAE